MWWFRFLTAGSFAYYLISTPWPGTGVDFTLPSVMSKCIWSSRILRDLGLHFMLLQLCCTEVSKWSFFMAKWLCIYMMSSVIGHFIPCHMMKIIETGKDGCFYNFNTRLDQKCIALLTNCQIREQITYKLPN